MSLRTRVEQKDLQPGKNYVIRGVRLRLGIDLNSPDIPNQPYNNIYYETDSEDLALGFVRNVIWHDIPYEDRRNIISNVHPEDEYEDDLLVSEFTEVVRLNGSMYPPFLSIDNVRFITPMGARIEFYEALPTDIEAPPPVASEVDVGFATPSSSDYPQYVTDGDSVSELETTDDARWIGGKTKRKLKTRKSKLKTRKSKRKH